ncbi:MAG TPA: hypothetical protein VGI40_14470 [Pirellulaceae bacterium]
MNNQSRLSFSIRDLFWLMTIAALAIGWFAHWASSTIRFERLQQEHIHVMTTQSDASVVGLHEKVNQMKERGDYQRKLMEEKKKGLQEGAEFSYRYLQELKKARAEQEARRKASEDANSEASNTKADTND